MTFSKARQLFLVSSIGLLAATFLAACSSSTVNYVYVGTSGGINIFSEDSSSGALRTLQSTQTSGVSTPVAMVSSADYANLYVLNKGTLTINRFGVNGDGSLSLQSDSVTLPSGSTPVSLAVNAADTYLYVVYQYASSAYLREYALSSGAISSLITTQQLTVSSYTSDAMLPSGVAVLPNSTAVFVTAYDQNTSSSISTPGWVFGFTVGSGGALTAYSTSPWQAGVKPSAILAELTNRYVYVTDYSNAKLIAYSVVTGTGLEPLTTNNFKTGSYPAALAIDPRGRYVYVANSLDSSVTAFVLDLGTGTPTTVGSASSSAHKTDPTPVAIVVDQAVGLFVLTANYDGNDVSAFKLSSDTGEISVVQSSPFYTSSAPTSIVSIPHGNHATQVVSN